MQRAHSGMKGFAVVWTGQFIPLPGAAMTTFALTLRAYETTPLDSLAGYLFPMIRQVEDLCPITTMLPTLPVRIHILLSETAFS